MNIKEIIGGIVVGAILSGAGSYVLLTNQITALETKLGLLEQSSLDFKKAQNILGDLATRQASLNERELEMQKKVVKIDDREKKLNEKELVLERNIQKYNQLNDVLNRERKRLSLTARGEKYVAKFIENYSGVNRQLKIECNEAHNKQVREAKATLSMIQSIAMELPIPNEFSRFVIDNGSNGTMTLRNDCVKFR